MLPVDDAAPTRLASTEAVAPSGSTRRRWLPWIVAGILAALLVAGAVAIVASRGPSGANGTDGQAAALETFLDRMENVLDQSAAGRREILDALTAGLDCSITPAEAARRIGSVAQNRQSILGQLGSLSTPTGETAALVTLLQRALQDSIEADRHYRDGFRASERTRRARCRARATSNWPPARTLLRRRRRFVSRKTSTSLRSGMAVRPGRRWASDQGRASSSAIFNRTPIVASWICRAGRATLSPTPRFTRRKGEIMKRSLLVLVGLALVGGSLWAASVASSAPVTRTEAMAPGLLSLPRATPAGQTSLYGHIASLSRQRGRWMMRFDPALLLRGVTAAQAAREDTGSSDVPTTRTRSTRAIVC